MLLGAAYARAGGRSPGLNEDVTIQQLTAIQSHEDARGRIVIEDKDSMRRRGVRSPDRAESLMLAFAGA